MQKEGGWGWVVVGSSLMVHLITCGICHSSGVLLLQLQSQFTASTFVISWGPALLMSLTVLMGIPAMLLSQLVGCRTVVVLGGLIASAGWALIIVTKELNQLLICLSVIGLGFGMALAPSKMIIDQYFYDKKEIALGISISGIGLGIFIFPILMHNLAEYVAWKGAILILSGISLNLVLCGVIMRPYSFTPPGLHFHKSIAAPSLLSNCQFASICICNFLWSLGSTIIYVYLPSYALDLKTTEEEAMILVSGIGLSAALSRTIFLIFGHESKFDIITTFLCSIGLSGILAATFTELFKHYTGLLAYAIIFGFHTGFWTPYMLHQVSGSVDQVFFNVGQIFLALTLGLGSLAGAPLAGWIYDKEKDFEIAFYLGGACLLASSVIMMLGKMQPSRYIPKFKEQGKTAAVALENMGKENVNSSEPEERDNLMVCSVLTTV